MRQPGIVILPGMAMHICVAPQNNSALPPGIILLRGITMHIIKDDYWHNSFDIYGGRSGRVGRSLLRELVEMLAFSAFLYLLVRTALPSFWVEGESMLPTLYSQERVLVNEALYFRYDANFFSRLADP